MAIYHLEAKVVSRGAGRSAVAASAYLSCSRLYNDYDGIQHDYTKKQGLVWQEVFLPEYAPQEWQDREKLWNAVEEVETAKDSRLAREFVVALPIELSREQQIELLQGDLIAQRVGKLDSLDIAQGFPLELIGQVGNTVRPAVFVPQQIDNLLHGHALTDDVRLDLISQIGFHQLFTSIFS